MTAVCGPITIVENTMHRLTQRIYEMEQNLDQPDMSLSWSNGQIYRFEVAPETKRLVLQKLRNDRDWMRTNLEVSPARGAADLPADLNAVTARFGSDFLDEARAAQGSGRLFICEDHALRLLVVSALNIAATWLQPVLMLAKSEGHMSSEGYRNAMVSLIDSHLDFISVDGQLLVDALGSATSFELPKEFLTVTSRLGGAKADLASHIKVAGEAIAVFWRNLNLPMVVRQSAVGHLLEKLCRERSLEHVRLIIRVLLLFNRRILQDARFENYIVGWIRGHFIPSE